MSPWRDHSGEMHPNWRLVLVLGWLLFNTGVCAIGLYALQYQGEKGDAKLCRVTNDARKSLKDLLSFAEMRSVQGADPDRREAVMDFYKKLNARVKIVDCPSNPSIYPWK